MELKDHSLIKDTDYEGVLSRETALEATDRMTAAVGLVLRGRAAGA